METISIKLPKELNERLNLLARVTGRTKDFYIAKAIEIKIDELEHYYILKKRFSNLE